MLGKLSSIYSKAHYTPWIEPGNQVTFHVMFLQENQASSTAAAKDVLIECRVSCVGSHLRVMGYTYN